MDVSVVVPSYNHAPYVRECITSALEQTAPPREVIVVDDGSTDGSREVIAEFGSAVRALFQENRGTYAALNSGIEQCRGDWIAFHNSDDAWAPEKLELQCDLARGYPDVSLVHTAVRYVDAAGRPYRFQHGEPGGITFDGPPVQDMLATMLHSNPVAISSVIVPRAMLDRIGRFDERYLGCGDWDLCARLSELGPFGFVREPVTLIRRHAANSSTDESRLKRLWQRDDGRLLNRGTLRRCADTLYERALGGRAARGESALALASLATYLARTDDAALAPAVYRMSLRLDPLRLRTLLRYAASLAPGGRRSRARSSSDVR